MIIQMETLKGRRRRLLSVVRWGPERGGVRALCLDSNAADERVEIMLDALDPVMFSTMRKLRPFYDGLHPSLPSGVAVGMPVAPHTTGSVINMNDAADAWTAFGWNHLDLLVVGDTHYLSRAEDLAKDGYEGLQVFLDAADGCMPVLGMDEFFVD